MFAFYGSECNPMLLPSVSITCAMNPNSPMPILGKITLPPAASAKLNVADYQKPEDHPLSKEVTDIRAVTSYNNFYELGTGKGDPKKNAHHLKSDPWSVAVEGECAKPGIIGLEDLISPHKLEERIYRLRCVEAWSMVVPWLGVELGPVLKRFEPTNKAKYVEFLTILDPENLPGQRRKILEWPYREGLRMDEAMHPLTILATGLYGELIPNQNGAPLRLVVPWKYGFKQIKSIVRFTFTDKRPKSFWEKVQPREYGFWANVNPKVDHPRWSQATEKLLGTGKRVPTLLYNGYAEQVAGLYTEIQKKEKIFY